MVYRYGTVCPETCDQHGQASKELLIAETEDQPLYDWAPEISFAIGYPKKSNCFGTFVEQAVEEINIWAIRTRKDEVCCR